MVASGTTATHPVASAGTTCYRFHFAVVSLFVYTRSPSACVATAILVLATGNGNVYDENQLRHFQPPNPVLTSVKGASEQPSLQGKRHDFSYA